MGAVRSAHANTNLRPFQTRACAIAANLGRPAFSILGSRQPFRSLEQARTTMSVIVGKAISADVELPAGV